MTIHTFLIKKGLQQAMKTGVNKSVPFLNDNSGVSSLNEGEDEYMETFRHLTEPLYTKDVSTWTEMDKWRAQKLIEHKYDAQLQDKIMQYDQWVLQNNLNKLMQNK
jgi:hypothetical protein